VPTLARDLLNRIFTHCVTTPAPYDLKRPCRVWGGRPERYGTIDVRGKRRRVHRAVYEAMCGKTDLLVCHHCDRPGCCEPTHLWAGTNSQNVRDCVRKGRNAGPGELRPAWTDHSRVVADQAAANLRSYLLLGTQTSRMAFLGR
jgi:hypothetical protein